MRRAHLAKDDLDWLPERYRLLRGAVVSGIWTAIGAGFAALVWTGAPVLVFAKGFVVIGAAGYGAGDWVSKKLVRARLGRLASGRVDLAKLSNEEDGELVHVRGRVRAQRTIAGIVSSEPGVYRRTRVSFDDIEVVAEEAVDFQLVDDQGNAIGIEVDGARLLTADDKLARTLFPERLFPLAEPEAARRVVQRFEHMLARGKRQLPRITAAEIMIKPGDELEAVGYKSRKIDPTVMERMARETPMRATLCSGRELPLILTRVQEAGA